MTMIIDKDSGALNIDREDDIIKGVMITQGGQIIHPQFAQQAQTSKAPAPKTAAKKPAAKKTAAKKATTEKAAAKPTNKAPSKKTKA
jgi:NAD(P) transhydrogenase subunit alpha